MLGFNVPHMVSNHWQDLQSLGFNEFQFFATNFVSLCISEPINTFHTINKQENYPIRLSYHRSVHYNSVVDPTQPSVGVGLGMPSFYPGVRTTFSSTFLFPILVYP